MEKSKNTPNKGIAHSLRAIALPRKEHEHIFSDEAKNILNTPIYNVKEIINGEEKICQFLGVTVDGYCPEDIPSSKVEKFYKYFNWLADKEYIYHGILAMPMAMSLVSKAPNGTVCGENGYSATLNDKPSVKVCEPEEVIQRCMMLIYVISDYTKDELVEKCKFEAFHAEGEIPRHDIEDKEWELHNYINAN